MEDQQTILSQCKKMEMEIKKLERSDEKDSLMRKLRGSYEILIEDFYDFAVENDVEVLLWGSCVYPFIDGFRTDIKTLQNMLRKKSDQQIKKEFKKVVGNFKNFLKTTIDYYQNLISYIKREADVSVDDAIHIESDDDFFDYRYSITFYRSLLYIGDLMRYHKDLYSSSARDDWVEAEKYYLLAIKLWPSNGHPHNQLAVLSAYNRDRFSTMYHYVRSLAVDHPFKTAKENLISFFGTNKKILNNEKSSYEEQLIAKLIYMFELGYLNQSLSEVPSVSTEVINGVADMLQPGIKSEKIVLRIFSLLIFLLDKVELSNIDDYYSNTVKTMSMKYFGKILDFSLTYEFSTEDPFCKFNMMMGISLFSSWIECNLDFLKQPNDRFVNEIWNKVRINMTNLLNIIIDYHDADSRKSKSPLYEEIELRGFNPLVNIFEYVDFSLPMLDETSESYAEIASERRLHKIMSMAMKVANCEYSKNTLFFTFQKENQQFSLDGTSTIQPLGSLNLKESLTLSKNYNFESTDSDDSGDEIIFEESIESSESSDITFEAFIANNPVEPDVDSFYNNLNTSDKSNAADLFYQDFESKISKDLFDDSNLATENHNFDQSWNNTSFQDISFDPSSLFNFDEDEDLPPGFDLTPTPNIWNTFY